VPKWMSAAEDAICSPTACLPLRSRQTEAETCTHACRSATAEAMCGICSLMGRVPHLLTHGTSGARLRAAAPASPAPHPAMLPDLGPRWLDLSLPWPDLVPASRPCMAWHGAAGARGKAGRSASMRGARRLGSVDRTPDPSNTVAARLYAASLVAGTGNEEEGR